MRKRLVILGSTGSIGLSALDVVARHEERIEILALSAHTNADLLLRQVEKYKPQYVTLSDKTAWRQFKERYDSSVTELLPYEMGIETLASHPEADIILNAIVGAAGLKASLKAVEANKRLALANKESMVIGGPLLNEIAAKTKAEIIPVDSEHSAIWQALFSGQKKEVKKILLTGSGGPFRETPIEDFASITKEMALKHPTWNMGAKITIDSATMMNKALEIIEAVYLFDMPPEKIEVVIHPQSVIHSMVEFVDSSIIAQMSGPDMRLPIAYAIFYPERLPSKNGHCDLTEVGRLTFEKPNFEKFPVLSVAYEVAREGGTSAAVFNAANEAAVAAFLNDAVEFHRIPDIVINAVEKHRAITHPSLNEILEADNWARDFAVSLMEK